MDIDPPTWRYLENLVWPPLDWSGAPHASQVSLRRRIPRRTSTEHESSARLVESFYPVRTGNSHVLLLSPQVELSPLYYHYVIYSLLEYKYSSYGAATTDFPNLMGFSLELPSYHLNDTEPLEPPLRDTSHLRGKGKGLTSERTPFLWQAPNANAALYFGDKWMEFHSFLTARLTKPPSSRQKVFSMKHPSWIEFLLELMRARGYSMLYPNFPSDGDAIANVHDELYQVPEEYSKKSTSLASTATELDPNEPLTAENEKSSRRSPPNTEHSLGESNLVSLLPNSGDLPQVASLPLLSYNGIEMKGKLSHGAATAFAEAFRREIGTCNDIEETTARSVNSALDLFCHLDNIYDPLQPCEYQYTNPHPQAVPEEDSIFDEDIILTEHHENAKQEASAHMARQQGRSESVHSTPVRPTPMQQRHQLQQDDSAETQNEFKKQMERQAKQLGGDTTPAPTPAPPVASKPAEVQGDSLKREAAAPPVSSPQPATPVESHDGFTKQPPPKAVEDPKADQAQEKGTGW